MKPEILKQISQDIVALLLQVSRDQDPQDFTSWFGGAILANVAGNLPDDYWQRMMDIKPCGVPACDCHLRAMAMMRALDSLRRDHKRNTPRSHAE